MLSRMFLNSFRDYSRRPGHFATKELNDILHDKVLEKPIQWEQTGSSGYTAKLENGVTADLYHSGSEFKKTTVIVWKDSDFASYEMDGRVWKNTWSKMK